MPSFEDALDKAVLPFKTEYRQKCSNRSVIGGFDKYLQKWLQEAESNAPDEKNKNAVLKLLNLAKGYSKGGYKKRKQILKDVYNGVTHLKNKRPEMIKGELEEPVSREVKTRVADKLKDQKDDGLDSPVTVINGVGSRSAVQLAKAGITSVGDLIFHLPRDYQDHRRVAGINKVKPGEFNVVTGALGRIDYRRIRGRLNITKAALTDENGSISLVWFNQPYIKKALKPGRRYVVSGKAEYKFKSLQISSPEMELLDEGFDPQSGAILPVYPLTEGIGQKFMRRIINRALEKYARLATEVFPADMLKRLALPSVADALKAIHNPDDREKAERAAIRLRFEEAFFMQLIIAKHRSIYKKRDKPRKYVDGKELLKEFTSKLPFELTVAQIRVIDEILEDMNSSCCMNRLLQGDVGSGKTVVCAFFTLLAARSGYQSAIMAPTEVLAEQHFYRFKELMGKFDVPCELLAGAINNAGKRMIKDGLETGITPVVVGTHALIQEDVKFKKLGFAVVDEQHKFGVIQRAALKKKGADTDFLFTTATPIPRSLTLTLYGDLDISVIDETPPGRQPVKSMWITPGQMRRVYDFVKKEVEKERQVYIVCPLIDESEKIEGTPLTDEYENVQNRFPDFRIGILHGRMKGYEKEEIMSRFAAGEIDVLVSTTVIEVGVDVANATVMVILDANRYGLGQLHQLRGRVGRGKEKSYCIMVAKRSGSGSDERLQTLLETDSGFEIAEADLEIRGPGDLIGSRQSGLPELRFLDVVRDYKVIQKAREEAFRLYKEDPEFLKKVNFNIKEKLENKYKKIWDIMH